jgi:hypothetical protein
MAAAVLISSAAVAAAATVTASASPTTPTRPAAVTAPAGTGFTTAGVLTAAAYGLSMTSVLSYAPIAAAGFGVPQFVPQMLKLRATRETAGVSWAWAALTTVSNAAWIA